MSFKDNKKVRPFPVNPRRGPDALKHRQVKRILVPQRENAIVNRLNKTKVEKFPDLKQEKDDHLRELRQKDQAALQARVCPVPSTSGSGS